MSSLGTYGFVIFYAVCCLQVNSEANKPGQNAASVMTLETTYSGDWFAFKTPGKPFSQWLTFVDLSACLVIAVKGEPQMLSDPFRWFMGF